MSEGIEVRVNDVGDILSLRFRKAKIADCREVDDRRCADYDSEGDLIGVELIGLPGGVSLRGLPEAERIREALLAHGPRAGCARLSPWSRLPLATAFADINNGITGREDAGRERIPVRCHYSIRRPSARTHGSARRALDG